MNHLRSQFISLVILLSLAGAGCQAPATSTPTADPGPTGTVLALVGPNGGHALSMADLKALPATEGQAGIKSSTGQITIPEQFKGVSIKDLIASLGPIDASMGVTITAEDGYSMTFSYDQVMNGTFISYDPATGNELATHDPLTAIIAYEHNGQPLDSTQEGVLRAVVVSAKNNQVVDGHWSVKWVNRVEVAPIGEAWTLDLTGAISSPVTRDSYQSCGSPGCHGLSWQDADGQTWVGVPVWLLVGEVDDADSHSENAYNHALAEAGYTVDLIASDGFTVTLDSKLINDNNDILVAFQVNEAELPESYYPLRLVGVGLDKSQMVGQIAKIQVNVQPAVPSTPTGVPANAGSIKIEGLVNQEITFKDSDLRAMNIVTLTAQGKEGPQEFQGVYLNPLLDLAGIKTGATKLLFTAADNYSVELDLAVIRDCPKALLAFMETPGKYMIVLPEQPTSTWVKDIVTIKVK